jgi:hypothetical protein
MLPSRKLAATFFAVFALGAVVGGLVVYNMGTTRFSTFLDRTSDPDSLAQRIDKKLAAQYHLDDGEQQRISPITREMAQDLFQERRDFATKVLATIDESHAKIAAQMTSDQRAAYLKDNELRRQRAAAMLLPSSNAPGTGPAAAQQ